MIRKKIAVIGLGSFGKVLVERLFLEGHEVLAIDIAQSTVEDVKDICTASVRLDATDDHALKSQGLEEMDIVVISVAENFEALVVAADILKQIGVKQIFARYKTELQKRILKLIGVDFFFNPEETAATNMAEMLRHGSLISNFFLSDEYRIAEVKIPESLVGSQIQEAMLREKFSLNIITIKRRTKPVSRRRNEDEKEISILGILSGDERFKSEDTLILFGKQKDINKFIEL
ncbi:MAG: TrkA family potassium uptake protein [Leptospiraceae bacterium]|jgi:trk system potassium uptake protein TrkA|nr:TrkA family potassium uptake protein [Leptospiraceae bacterium]MCZ8344984.1 TrkA family potassium uptake protein [Leptospiraceae bacterium]PJE05008.1 MAG: potassium transporter TrkA [Leptospira sp.]